MASGPSVQPPGGHPNVSPLGAAWAMVLGQEGVTYGLRQEAQEDQQATGAAPAGQEEPAAATPESAQEENKEEETPAGGHLKQSLYDHISRVERMKADDVQGGRPCSTRQCSACIEARQAASKLAQLPTE